MDIKIAVNIFYPPVDWLLQILQKNKNIYIPINGGSGLRGHPNLPFNIIFDDEGENISSKNKVLNEMTTLYWIWKNYEKIGNPDFIGHNHYRRFFDLKDVSDFEKHDMIVSKPIFSSQQYSLAWQYGYYHVIEDLQKCCDSMRNVIGQDIGDAFTSYMNTSGVNFAPCNMFIMKKSLFFEWCEFLFPLIFDLENKIDTTGRDNYQKRALCFLSERIFNFWCYNKFINGFNVKQIGMKEYLDFKPEKTNERGDYS